MNTKHIIAAAFAALVATTAAHATDVAVMPNHADGMIVLTDVIGNCLNGARQMYSTNGSGAVLLHGCWRADEPWVFVQYDNETYIRRYPEDNFRLTNAGTAAAHAAGYY
ncbi:hypothetical protein [Paraburkholderia youngii]|uniref:hypothetical protein n=1 Tax=Paraburkholderia youngii TaxID=2782701 RepID=UPI003D1DB6E3